MRWKFLFAVGVCCCSLQLGLNLSADEVAVKELAAGLKSSEESTRIQAADQLAEFSTQAASAVAPLTALLEDKSAVVRAHAAHALGQIGEASKPAVPMLVKLVKDTDPLVRSQAVKAVLAIKPGPEVTIPLCVKLLQASDTAAQQRILMAISAAGPQAVPALIEALQIKDAAYWACIILRDMGPAGKAAIPALVEALKDARSEIRCEAALALGSMEAEASQAIPSLATLLTDKTESVAVAATYALARIGNLPAEVDKAIRQNTQSKNPMLSATSMWAYAVAHPEDKELRVQVTERLIKHLSDTDPFVRVAAARGLAALPPAPEIILPIWEKALEGADETTLAHALDALAQLGAPAVPHLVKALEYEPLRPEVIEILHQLGPDAVAATLPLSKLVADPNDHIAHSAILALASIGPGAELAVPALGNALKQKDNAHKHALVYTLGRIGPAAAKARGKVINQMVGDDLDLMVVSAWALIRIDPSENSIENATAALAYALKAESATTRRGAVETLGELRTHEKKAIAALEKTAKEDKDPTVRDAAAKALKLIKN